MADNEIKVPCDLDKESVEFLESKLGAKINPHLETEKDYNKAIFYFKCCGLQDKAANGENNPFPIDYYSTKEKADLMFENVYKHALDFQKLMDSMMTGSAMSDDEMLKLSEMTMSGMAAQTATTNESLSPALHSLSESKAEAGNAQLTTTINFETMSQYTDGVPNLAEEMNERYNAAVTMAAADIAPHLPEGANLQDYLPIVKEHPKAVLALAITAEANKESKIPFTLSSPEELLSKCQHPAVVELSDKISFNDLNGSKKEVYAHAQPVIGLGRESMNQPTISRAKVNEG